MGVVYNVKRYVTYLEPSQLSEFDPKYIHTNLSSIMYSTKPNTCWWGSPVNAEYSWKDWCESNEFGEYDFDSPIYWTLEPGSKVFQIGYKEVEIDSHNPLMKYIRFKDWNLKIVDDMPIEAKINILKSYDYHLRPIIDFDEILSDDIVAVELLDSGIGHRFSNSLEIEFNCWDCESIAVLDPSKIIFER